VCVGRLVRTHTIKGSNYDARTKRSCVVCVGTLVRALRFELRFGDRVSVSLLCQENVC
jgi:hypothetical protein